MLWQTPQSPQAIDIQRLQGALYMQRSIATQIAQEKSFTKIFMPKRLGRPNIIQNRELYMDNAVLKIYKQRLLQQFTFKESKQIAERLAQAKDILRTQELKNNLQGR